jgi:hypothetical protein
MTDRPLTPEDDPWADDLALRFAKRRTGGAVHMDGRHNPLPSEVIEARTFVREMRAAAIARDREEDDRGLALRWDADMRAIKRWQAAHPERGEVWPDHADMVVWLLDKWLAMRVAIEEHVEVGCITGHTGGNLVRLLALDAPEAQS